MRKFIKKIIVFSLPIIVFMLIADLYISNQLKNYSGYPGEIEVWNDIYGKNIEVDIAIYGSSRAWVHIDPKILKDSLKLKSYNFGMDGHNFWLQYLRHQEYLKHNKSPKLIILSVDIFSLQKRNDLYQSLQFSPYMLWNDSIYKYTSSYIGFTKKDYFIPLLRYNGNIRKIKNKLISSKYDDDNYRNNGFRGMDREWSDDLKKAKTEIDRYKIKIDPLTIILFDRFLSECKAKNIKVVLVYTPEYTDGQKFTENRKEIIDIYKDFSDKYNLNFLDYSSNNICHKKDLFYNASHLNKNGATIFSRKLCNDIKILGVL